MKWLNKFWSESQKSFRDPEDRDYYPPQYTDDLEVAGRAIMIARCWEKAADEMAKAGK